MSIAARDTAGRAIAWATSASILLLPLATRTARASDQAYDQDNQYGAIAIGDRDPPMQPFDRARILGAETVNDRDRPFFRQQGIRAGNYIVLPQASYTITHDDNIFGTNTPTADLRHELSGAMKLESRLPRHVLDIMFGGRAVAFQNNEDRNYADGFLGAKTRLDINRGHAFVGNFMSTVDHEERFGGEQPRDAKRPVEYWQNDADIGFVRNVGRLSAIVGATAQRKEYRDTDANDGSKILQAFRNSDTYSGYTRLRYSVSPGYTLTARAAYIHEDNKGNSEINRSNRGFEAAAGVDFELTRLVKAGLEAGYTQRNFTSATLDDINGLLYEARLAWLITPLVTLYGKARREVTSTSFAGASGRIDDRLTAQIDYEPLNNLLLSATLEYSQSDFVGTNRHDVGWGARLGAQYAVNTKVLLTLRYEHLQLKSNAESFSFEGNKIMAGITLRY
jgi:hypothetical protein